MKNANGWGNPKSHRPFYIADEINKYLKILRKREFLLFKTEKETKKYKIYGLLIYQKFLNYKMHKLGIKLWFNIPVNTIGPGFKINHWGFLAINSNSKIGKNCQVFGDVTIGSKDHKSSEAPVIGDNVVIGAGARIIGPIKIASNCVIGANAVVINDVLEEGSTVVGIPARIVK